METIAMFSALVFPLLWSVPLGYAIRGLARLRLRRRFDMVKLKPLDGSAARIGGTVDGTPMEISFSKGFVLTSEIKLAATYPRTRDLRESRAVRRALGTLPLGFGAAIEENKVVVAQLLPVFATAEVSKLVDQFAALRHEIAAEDRSVHVPVARAVA